ncbi:MAG TPA: hypothetical protein VFS20_07025 [Longimicrobium sp.]|nr:hypothetical protein [Longimicrobium sp.]
MTLHASDASSPPAPDASTGTESALRRFERSLRTLYPQPARAAARFWETVDTHGFPEAMDRLLHSQKSYGVVFRNRHGEFGDTVPEHVPRLAKEAFVLRGFRPPPERMAGPLEAMVEREAVSRARAIAALGRIYQQPDRALQALELVARADGPEAAAKAATEFPPELGPARSLRPILRGGEVWETVRSWATKHQMIHSPDRAVAWHLDRFRTVLRRDFADVAAAEAQWRRAAELHGSRAAAAMLKTPAGELLRLSLHGRTERGIAGLANAVARAEAVAESAGAYPARTRERQAMYRAAADLTREARLRDAAAISVRIHEEVERLEGMQAGVRGASYFLRTGIEGCRQRLVPVVREPETVILAFLKASEPEQVRMRHALRSDPESAREMFGEAGELVQTWGWRRESRTAAARQRAPFAAIWLEHLADARRGLQEARRAAAFAAHAPEDKDANAVESSLATRIRNLKARATALDALRTELWKQPSPAHEYVAWPPQLRQQVERFSGVWLPGTSGVRAAPARQTGVEL